MLVAVATLSKQCFSKSLPPTTYSYLSYSHIPSSYLYLFCFFFLLLYNENTVDLTHNITKHVTLLNFLTLLLLSLKVVCPVSLVGQWVSEAKSKLVKGAALKIYEYHGSNRIRDAGTGIRTFNLMQHVFLTLLLQFSY